jgi:hypothetical protein
MENKLAVISQSTTQKPSASDALVREWLFRFGVNFEKDVAPVLPLWLEAFGGLKPETLEPLFRKALNTCKFFPKIADILEHAEQAKANAEEEAAAQKWTQVREYIRLHYNPDLRPQQPSGPRISERTQRAINAAGGLPYLSECIADDLVFARKRFIESYLRWDELHQEQFLLPDGEIKNLLAAFSDTKALTYAGPTFEELHEKGLAYSEELKASGRAGPNLPGAMRAIVKEAEPSPVIDTDGRRRELARQAEQIKSKYAPELEAAR